MSRSSISFVNKPNIEYMLQVMCELYGRQSGGSVESTYTISPKNATEEADRKNG